MTNHQPTYSIIICTYNRVNYLKKCFDSLLELQNFNQAEIIIINDGSTDETRNFLASLNYQNLKITNNQQNLGISKARNLGIEQAQGEIIAFTDDDCCVDRNWLINLINGFTKPNTGLVIGQTFYISKDYQGYFPERLVRNLNAHWPMSSNIAYKKEVFDKIGNFDPLFFYYNNEDTEIAIRAVASGYEVERALNAIVYHQPANWSTTSLLKSARNSSVWPLLKKKYPHHYLYFKPKIKFGFIINAEDYLYFLILPIFIPLLLLRYLINGKRDLKIFFTKWPVYLILRRYYIYKESWRSGVFMI